MGDGSRDGMREGEGRERERQDEGGGREGGVRESEGGRNWVRESYVMYN